MQQTNEYGYVWQKGNRYFCQVGATTHYNSGFKTKSQFEEWITKEFEKHGLDWRAKYAWKYKDNLATFILVKKGGEELK